jgi:hypothetical protein
MIGSLNIRLQFFTDEKSLVLVNGWLVFSADPLCADPLLAPPKDWDWLVALDRLEVYTR